MWKRIIGRPGVVDIKIRIEVIFFGNYALEKRGMIKSCAECMYIKLFSSR